MFLCVEGLLVQAGSARGDPLSVWEGGQPPWALARLAGRARYVSKGALRPAGQGPRRTGIDDY